MSRKEKNLFYLVNLVGSVLSSGKNKVNWCLAKKNTNVMSSSRNIDVSQNTI